MNTKAVAENTTTACSTAVSWLPTACWVRLPRPLRPKTASVTTAPASNSPNSTPAMVSVGSSALRATCFHSTQWRVAPLARATATKGWVSTSSMLRSRICASGAEIGMARVSVGSTSPSQRPGLITGIQPRRKETTWISMMPSQNTGTETNSEGSDCSAERSQRSGASCAANASATASSRAVAKPKLASRSVGGRLVASPWLTGTPACTE